jgi:alpha-tubulin suppressor-like RCC1 family protein
MSYRYPNAMIKPGLNTLVAPTPTFLYELYSWGRNANGQLGLGNTTDYSSPKQIGSDNWVSLGAVQGRQVAAIKPNGTLWTWGANAQGQLGLGNTTSYSSPKQVGSLTNWLTLSSGPYASVIAIKTDGTLWSWGRNTNGELGLGNTTAYSSPKQVGSLTDWLKLSSGYYHTIAVKTNGTLWTWGRNNIGQLGQGNTTDRSSPVQVGALTTWMQCGAGGGSVSTAASAAIKTDGTLWVWGANNFGTLGLGNTTLYSSPKQVGSLTNWAYINVGNGSMFAVKTDGTLWSWGLGGNGILGLGNSTNYSSPKQVGSLTNWLQISSTYRHAMAIKTDGTLWGWGSNSFGRIGLGNTTSYSSPKQVGALTNWLNVAASWYSTVAITSTSIFPYTQYGGIWRLNSASAAKGAGTWP